MDISLPTLGLVTSTLNIAVSRLLISDCDGGRGGCFCDGGVSLVVRRYRAMRRRVVIGAMSALTSGLLGDQGGGKI